jgi:hypothetical protein
MNIIKTLLREGFNLLSEIDWEGEFSDVQKTCVNPNELVDYLNRVRANSPLKTADREKFSKDLPYVHAKSDVFKKNETTIDIDTFIKTITSTPKSVISTNEKILKSGGPHEFVYKTGVPAIKGIVYDIDEDKFYYVKTCPGAGSCVGICYAIRGNYIRYPNSYDVMTKRINLLLNNPQAYEEQLYNEIKARAEEHKAYEGYKNKVIIRWNDSGDFFTKRYLQIAERVMRKIKEEGFNVDSYAYTKVGDIANNSELDSVSFSSGANKPETEKVDTEKTKNAVVIPTNMFKDLDLMKISDEKELKSRVANKFKLNPEEILTYDELMRTPYSENPKWNVIVTPNDGDDAGFRKDVKRILLTQH